jgi:hypothetical protein
MKSVVCVVLLLLSACAEPDAEMNGELAAPAVANPTKRQIATELFAATMTQLAICRPHLGGHLDGGAQMLTAYCGDPGRDCSEFAYLCQPRNCADPGPVTQAQLDTCANAERTAPCDRDKAANCWYGSLGLLPPF